MKKTILAAILLSLSAPLAIAHENHDHGDDAAVIKPPQTVRKAEAPKPKAAKPTTPAATEKAEEPAQPAPEKK